ncbi:MAG: DUF5010 domain-containing protein [Planctomycetota bacterium]
MLSITLVLLTCSSLSTTPPPQPGEERAPERLLGTYYFYWYRYPGEHFHHPQSPGGDSLKHHFPDPTKVSYLSSDWHEKEIRDMRAAGIDFFLPVFWGIPDKREKPDVAFSYRGLPPLAEALDRVAADGLPYPKVGLFYDTSTLLHGTRGEAGEGAIDLTQPEGKKIFAATVRSFFEIIPERHWALADNRVLVFLYASFGARYDETLVPPLRESMAAAFGGRGVYLVKERSWGELEADSVYAWGAALHGPQLLETASLGPGYDDSRWPGRETPVREREGSAFYRDGWRQVLESPARLVLVETWNEMHEGTAVCETAEWGRQYIDLTAEYARKLHAGESRAEAPALRFPRARPADGREDGWELRGRSRAFFAAGPPYSQGIWPCNLEEAPIAYREEGGRSAIAAAAPCADGGWHLFFQVADPFYSLPRDDLEIALDFVDTAKGSLLVRAGDEAPLTIELAGDRSEKRWSARLRRPRLLNTLPGGADIELRAADCLPLQRLELTKVDGLETDRGVQASIISCGPEERAKWLEGARRVETALLRIPVSWAVLAPSREELDTKPVIEAVQAATGAGFRVLVAIGDPPRWAQPTWEFAADLGRLTEQLARDLGERVEAYEILPAPNTATGLPPAPLIEGYLRLLREGAAGVHRADPAALVVSGCVKGRDLPFLELLIGGDRGLHFDVLGLAPVLDEIEASRSGLGEYVAQVRSQHVANGLAEIPIWITDAAYATGTPAAMQGTWRELVGRIARAGLVVAREEEPPLRAVIVDDATLPRLRGLPHEIMVSSLESAGFEVRSLQWPATQEEMAPAEWPLLVLPFGEVFDPEMLAWAFAFLDRGGTLFPVSGLPFGYRCRRGAGGASFEAAAAYHAERLEELWLKVVPAPPSAPGAPLRLAEAPLAAGLIGTPPEVGSLRELLQRRKGVPRNATANHLYDPLVTAWHDGEPAGEVAALTIYPGRKLGRLLLTTVDPGFRHLTPPHQAGFLEDLLQVARDAGVKRLYWRALYDTGSDGEGLIRVDDALKPAALVFRRRPVPPGR